ncbi:MAG: TatD family hydrolase [Anaerolineaceae bacterium]|nr:TatD family hydrolase [Anaerolineaceae bacterium]
MPRLIDTHCHLNLNLFQNDLANVLARAWENGIERILIPGIDLETSRRAVELCENDPKLFAAVGFHPSEARAWDQNSRGLLIELAKHPKVVAVGEIGLDYYRDRAHRDLQIEVFLEQLEMASNLEKPVIIHNRQAIEDIWPILTEWQAGLVKQGTQTARRPGVLHSYEGTIELALKAVQLNFAIGMGGPVTFRNAPDRQHLASAVPLNGLVLETDAPFLTPHPHRGERNEPAYISLIASKIADLKNKPLEQIAEITSSNADRLFAWGAPV